MTAGTKLTAVTLGILAASYASAQKWQEVDFANMPAHTVTVGLSELGGQPTDFRWEGYYLYREGDRITLLAHRPNHRGEHFVGKATLDRGRFTRIESYTNQINDRFSGRGAHLDWDFHTRQHIAGLSFRPLEARYVAINVGIDYTGESLPAIFVGANRDRYKSGSGYILVDLTR